MTAAPTPHHSAALPLAAAVVSGAFVALQQRINGDLGRSLHDPVLAAVVSFGTGLVVVTALLLARSRSRGLLRETRLLPTWVKLGGLGGATLVVVGATAAPAIGVALLTIGLVAGSTIGALAVDRVGLAPGGPRQLTLARLAGASLCLLAIAISTAEGVRSASAVLLLLVVVAGGVISVQQALNGRVRSATDATVATFVNFVVGTVALLVGLGLRELLVGVQAQTWPGVDHAYLYLGGPIGASFVAVAALVVGRLGVLRLGLAVTAGQLLGAIALDLRRGVSTATLIAAGLTMVAVALSGRGRR